MLPDAIYKTPGLAFDASFVVVVEVETVGFDCTALELDAGGGHPIVVFNVINAVVGQFYFPGAERTTPQQEDPAVCSDCDTLVACLAPPTDGGGLEIVGQTPAASQPVLNVLVAIKDFVELLALAFVLLEIGAREIAKKAGKKSGIRSAGHWGTVLPLGVNALRLAHSEVLTGGGGSDS